MAGHSRSGRKPQTLTAQSARQSLNALTQPALDAIKKAVHEGDVPAARWTFEMVLGRPKQQTELTGKDDGPVSMDLSRVPIETLRLLTKSFENGAFEAFLESRPEFKALLEEIKD